MQMADQEENCYYIDITGSRKTKMCNVSGSVAIAVPFADSEDPDRSIEGFLRVMVVCSTVRRQKAMFRARETLGSRCMTSRCTSTFIRMSRRQWAWIKTRSTNHTVAVERIAMVFSISKKTNVRWSMHLPVDEIGSFHILNASKHLEGLA